MSPLKVSVFERHGSPPFGAFFARCALRCLRRGLGGCLGGLLGAGVPLAHADFFIHSWQNHHEPKQTLLLNPEFIYYSTHENYGPSGGIEAPPDLVGYSRLETDLTVAYGLKDFLTAYGRMAWGHTQLSLSQNRDSGSYGFLDQSVGLNFRLFERQSYSASHTSSLDLQVQTDFPSYSNATATATGTPFLGDGSVDITAGAFLTLPFLSASVDRMQFAAGAGYTYRTEQFSAAVPWLALIEYIPPAEGLTFQLAALGFFSLKTDPNANSAVLGPERSAGTGGSFITNAVNPSLLRIRGGLGYRFSDELSVGGIIDHSVWGQAAPSGLTVLFGLQASISTVHEPLRVDPVRQIPVEFGHSNQGLVTYSMDAKVVQANDRLNMVKIDKGLDDGVASGQLFDLFSVDKSGSPIESVARAKVTSARRSESVLTIIEYFKEVWVNSGFLAKRVVQ